MPHVIIVNPPHDGGGEAADKVIHKKFIRNIGLELILVFLKHFRQVLPEILHKKLAALAGEDIDNIMAVILQMIKQVCDPCIWTVSVPGEIMGGLRHEVIGENVAEDIGAHGLQQLILCLKVGIEGASPDIGPVYNILDRNIVIFLAGQ